MLERQPLDVGKEGVAIDDDHDVAGFEIRSLHDDPLGVAARAQPEHGTQLELEAAIVAAMNDQSVVDGGWTSAVARIMAAVGVSTTRLVISDKQPFGRFVTAHAQHRHANALRETGAAILICTETELNDQLGDRCSGSSQKSEQMAEDGDEI